MNQPAGRAGLSLLEIVIVLAVLAILAGLVAWQWPSPLGPATGALRNLVSQGRLEAVVRNEPVAVVLDAALGEYQLRHAAGASALADVCMEGPVLARLPLSDFRGVRPGPFRAGIVWLPTGYGRTCTGGAVFNSTIQLSHGAQQGRVIVSRAGRVRTELYSR